MSDASLPLERPLFVRLGSFLLLALTAILAMAVVGAFFPALPYLGFGQLTLAWIGPWIVILSALALWRSAKKWRVKRRHREMIQAAIALVALFGSIVIVTLQTLAIRESGTTVSLLRSLYFGPVAHQSTAAEIRQYISFDGEPLPLAIYRPAANAAGQPAPGPDLYPRGRLGLGCLSHTRGGSALVC